MSKFCSLYLTYLQTAVIFYSLIYQSFVFSVIWEKTICKL